MTTEPKPTATSPLLQAYRGEQPSRHPVWFMRQAGRSLPEYRAARSGWRMLDACLDPDLATEITLQPVRRHGVDAAIFFSDIVVPLRLAGIDVDIIPGTGPVLAEPIRDSRQVARLPMPDPAVLAPITAAVAQCVAELGHTPLIGFAGAPFTLACYLVEGGPSRERLHTKALMYSEPRTWHALMAWTAEVTAQFLRAQVEAGASAAQLFDSWAGALAPGDYRQYAAPHSAAVFNELADQSVPRVHFGVGTGELLVDMLAAGADVVGVDHHTDLATAIDRLGARCPVQGNIDPALLFAPRQLLHERVAEIVDAGKRAPGHVVNLGHGVPPSTDPDVLTELVEFIHSLP